MPSLLTRPVGLALTMITVTLALFFVVTIVVGLRVWVRAWLLRSSRTWGWDDNLVVMAYVSPRHVEQSLHATHFQKLIVRQILFILSTALAVTTGFYGVGTPDADLNEFVMMRAGEYFLYWQISMCVSVPFIKGFIVFGLLRLTQQRRFRYPLYIVMVSTVLFTIASLSALLLHCRPIAANWNPLVGACGSLSSVLYLSYVVTGINIAADLSCAIVPYFMVRGLTMPRRAKTSVMAILGLGLFASVATVARTPYFKYYMVPQNQLCRFDRAIPGDTEQTSEKPKANT